MFNIRLPRTYNGILSGLLALFCLSLPAQAEVIKVGGTGSALGTVRLLGDAFKQSDPNFSVTVVPNLGSSGSIRALVAGAIDLAVTSRALTEGEQIQGLVAHEYGKTPFVLIANGTTVTNISLKEVSDIYAGKKTQWSDGKPIRLLLRPAGDSDNLLLESISSEMKKALAIAHTREGMIEAVTDQDAVERLQTLPGAFGGSSLALLTSEQRPLTPLAIDGVTPSVATLANKTYPYFKTMFLVNKNQASPAVAHFVAFIQSPEGRRILTEHGHLVPEH
jgi:phosphate transport system substrate-binding protein